MGHYTLDCRQPAAFALVAEMIRELRPLFRSKHFNLCCDETFDLGYHVRRSALPRPGTMDQLRELVARPPRA